MNKQLDRDINKEVYLELDRQKDKWDRKIRKQICTERD